MFPLIYIIQIKILINVFYMYYLNKNVKLTQVSLKYVLTFFENSIKILYFC